MYELARGCATKLSLWWKGFWETNGFNLQRRSWPGGIRTPLPPELPSGVHAKRKNPVRIFFSEGGGIGGYTAADDELTRTPPEPSNQPTPLTVESRRAVFIGLNSGCSAFTDKLLPVE